MLLGSRIDGGIKLWVVCLACMWQGMFVQWVFEVRVRPGSYRVQGNTLGGNLWGENGEKMWGLEYQLRSNSTIVV